jgi:hypothetical protein
MYWLAGWNWSGLGGIFEIIYCREIVTEHHCFWQIDNVHGCLISTMSMLRYGSGLLGYLSP